jgi:hypothetical protein
MTLDRDLLREVRGLDEFDLRRLVLFVGELLATRAGVRPNGLGIGPSTQGPRTTYRRQLVRCGKPTCSRCPHGPYWYAYWRQDGRLRSRYVGKIPPPGATG